MIFTKKNFIIAKDSYICIIRKLYLFLRVIGLVESYVYYELGKLYLL